MFIKKSKHKTEKEKTSQKGGAKEAAKEFGLFIVDILYNAVVIIALVILIRSFLISPFRVVGSSMADTLQSDEFILIDKLSYHIGEPERGDPIVFLPPITNKYYYSYKIEEKVTLNDQGEGTLDMDKMQTVKNAVYCKNGLMARLFFCRDTVQSKDLVYYYKTGDPDSNWKNSKRREVTEEEVKSGKLSITGEAGETYFVRVYDAEGPEFFVKRIIGIPGDQIKIDNGRVYLKTPESEDFTEINEPYLNTTNQFNTYFLEEVPENTFTVPEGHYFTLGDNRTHSNDSRSWFAPNTQEPTPFVALENISGKVLVALWPLQHIRFIPGADL